MISNDAKEISTWFRDLQQRITSVLEDADGHAKFREDSWERPGGGGGQTRVIEKGLVIEKGGVNFSAVHGKTPEFMRKQNGADHMLSEEFYATGVSIVIHPVNPFVPIIHMNVRYFESSDGKTYWFGGGIDLTPHYVDTSDAEYFHTNLKSVCDRFNPAYYARFKQWADDYFFIRHRKETRGIGGIFFDQLQERSEGVDKKTLWNFVQAVGETFAPVYTTIIKRNRNKEFGEREKKWQHLRRGRYVEFNLVYDRGTRFGLETDGRTESILMSLPPMAEWIYDFRPEPDSEEQKTLDLLNKGINWIPGSLI